MFDPKLNLTFEPPYRITNGTWWTYPGIWDINEQRKGARSGVASWPQDPVYISKYQAYNRTRSFRDIIDQIFLWFNDPVEPINFGAIYYHEPDLTGLVFFSLENNSNILLDKYSGHRSGPYSENMTLMVRECDEYLGYLLDRIDGNDKLRENLHLIVTSDHGMEQINGTNNPLYIEDYIDLTKAKAYGIPTVMNIFVQSCKLISIYRNKICLFFSKRY